MWSAGSFSAAFALTVSGTDPLIALIAAFTSIGIATTVRLFVTGTP